MACFLAVVCFVQYGFRLDAGDRYDIHRLRYRSAVESSSLFCHTTRKTIF